MPTPSKGESQQSFMHTCVPYVMKEGKKQDQAVAECLNIFKKSRAEEGIDVAEEGEFFYHEEERSATIVLASGRPFKLSNVTREKAQAFYKRLKAEAAAMAARGATGDPLTFTGPSGIVTRGD
jgi:hypothetical protein